jgi:hypothetical protein
MRKDGWTEQEDRILLEMYGKFEYRKMLEKLSGRTKSAIAGRATKLGLKGNVRVTMSQASRKYEVNMKFFDRVSVDSACLAGLLAADGCVNDKKNRIQIRLKEEDGYLLREWAQRLGYTGPVSDYLNGGSYSPNNKHTYLHISGVPRWLKQLDKIYNITPRKSRTLIGPNLYEREHILAFMSGYIDGDGSIMFRHLKKKDPKSGKIYHSETWTIAFCGTKEECIWFKAHSDTFYPQRVMMRGIEKKEKKNGPTYQYRISGKRALLLLQDMLNLELPRLHRKWQPVIDYLKS